MFMLAIGYSDQREAAINSTKQYVFKQGELVVLYEAKSQLVPYLEEVCKDESKR